jgi:outer membrane receptor protein involved in Fe transport
LNRIGIKIGCTAETMFGENMGLVRSSLVALLASGAAAPLAAQTPVLAQDAADEIVEQNLIDLYDVLARTPNVAINSNRSSFTIRGIDAFNVSGAGDGALASVYVDSAVLANGPLDLHDIAQVEMFRGPQSTVRGRNALAGAVIVRTTDPGYDGSGRARLMLTGPNG